MHTDKVYTDLVYNDSLVSLPPANQALIVDHDYVYLIIFAMNVVMYLKKELVSSRLATLESIANAYIDREEIDLERHLAWSSSLPLYVLYRLHHHRAKSPHGADSTQSHGAGGPSTRMQSWQYLMGSNTLSGHQEVQGWYLPLTAG